MGAAKSCLGRTKALHATSLVLLCAKQRTAKETKCLSCFGRDFTNVLTPIRFISYGSGSNYLSVLNANFQSQDDKTLWGALILLYRSDVIIGTETWLNDQATSSELISYPLQYDIHGRDKPAVTHGEEFLANYQQK